MLKGVPLVHEVLCSVRAWAFGTVVFVCNYTLVCFQSGGFFDLPLTKELIYLCYQGSTLILLNSNIMKKVSIPTLHDVMCNSRISGKYYMYIRFEEKMRSCLIQHVVYVWTIRSCNSICMDHLLSHVLVKNHDRTHQALPFCMDYLVCFQYICVNIEPCLSVQDKCSF